MKELTARVLAIWLAVTLVFGSKATAAVVINDMNANHWAYSYVSDVIERQLMNLTTVGNFLPDEPIDKFETVRILAKLLGYQSENASYEDQSYYENAHQKYRGILSNYASNFTMWNSSTDREIAFLLEKGVLTEEDLYQFVIRDQSGSERLRPLSREEAVVLLTKALGKNNEALSLSYSYDFADDASINPSYKPYVYYFKEKQIVVGENGMFSPKSSVTRVTLAVLLSKSIQVMGGAAQYMLPAQTVNTNNAISTGAASTEQLTGTIDMLFPTMNAIQVQTADAKKNIYKLTSTAVITLNNVQASFNALQTGMTITGVLTNGEFTEVRAQGTAAPGSMTNTPVVVQTPAPTPIQTPLSNVSTQHENKVYEGIVYETGSVSSGTQISIERNVVSPRGDIEPEIITFTLAQTCSITRGDALVSFWDIERNEIAKITANGDIALNIQLEERNINIEGGTLMEKRYSEQNNTAYLVVKDTNEKIYELKVTAQTQIKRGSVGNITYDRLRMGDVVDVIAEYDKLLSVTAYGVASTVDGFIEEIHINASGSTITLRNSDNVSQKYTVIPGNADIYSVKLNDKVRLRLDSLEIENISILQTATSDYITGFIQLMKVQSFTLQDISASTGLTKEIYFDGQTKIVNSRTGEDVDMSYLRTGMKVYVSLPQIANMPAKTIIILID